MHVLRVCVVMTTGSVRATHTMFGFPRKGRQLGDEVVHQGDYNRGRDPLTLSRWPARLWLAPPHCITFLATTPRQPVLAFCLFIDSFNHHRNLKPPGPLQPFIYFRVV